MIGLLRGQLLKRDPAHVIVEVNGVGYRVFVPLSTYYRLPDERAEVLLHTVTHLREDALHLYGFITERERALFDLLRGVTGIGPRLAINILSGITAEELAAAIGRADLVRLSAIPGVGRKTSERIILELKEKILPLLEPAVAAPEGDQSEEVLQDVVSALLNLGYNRSAASKAAAKAIRTVDGDQDFETVIRQALRLLAEHAKG
ncbi:MAG TPA: Holliday junction branch migration protein RuvA [Candidatus Methylomirabilis sp.]|nr:Holliday junction branch migration protein RuvA [Candidatus Methylomirabilis sp.]